MMIMTAKEGYVFVAKNKKAVYGKTIYLGVYSKETDFIQVKEEEAATLRKELLGSVEIK